ncbi:hypothetical protein OUZ56_029195 [Daphnia magna]|uniref:Uncharacterized protein n=1 Tax=Daphnia magna TaxID=35525 RepID=A0ABR0B638_9CRUS|nr:hypothetical protein OUZ56_029195 [Daphnia magna]
MELKGDKADKAPLHVSGAVYYYSGAVYSSKTSYVARSPQMRKSHLCPSWSAAAAASYGETNFFIYYL